MKRTLYVTTACCAVVAVVNFALLFSRPVHAQSFGAFQIGPIAPAVANCPAGVAGSAVYCPVGTAAPYATYVSYNAGAYQLLVQPAAPAGVTGFGNPPRTGTVVLTKADITQTGIAAAVPSSSVTVAVPASSAPLQ